MAALTASRYTPSPLWVERLLPLFLGMHRAKDFQNKAAQILRHPPDT